jgi:SH3-like domain-containing protein
VAAPATATAPQPSLLVIHGANLRAGPSSTTAVIGLIPRDAKVTRLEKQGSWTRIRYAKGTDKPLEGWLFTSFLQGPRETTDKKTAAAP